MMPGITHMTLAAPGATPEEIQRGLEAAQRMLDAEGYDAYYAFMHRELWEIATCFGPTTPIRHDLEAGQAWEAACYAAVEACCADWVGDTPWPLGALNLAKGYEATMKAAYPELAATREAVHQELISEIDNERQPAEDGGQPPCKR